MPKKIIPGTPKEKTRTLQYFKKFPQTCFRKLPQTCFRKLPQTCLRKLPQLHKNNLQRSKNHIFMKT